MNREWKKETGQNWEGSRKRGHPVWRVSAGVFPGHERSPQKSHEPFKGTVVPPHFKCVPHSGQALSSWDMK
jgi:hypothetical protein